MTGFEVNFLRSHPLRDSTVTRYLNIYDIKSPQDHNEHVENFEMVCFHSFLNFILKTLMPIVPETWVRVQNLSLKSVQGVQDLSFKKVQVVQDLSSR